MCLKKRSTSHARSSLPTEAVIFPSSFASLGHLLLLKMTLPILKGLHQGYLHSLFDEGIVNDQFNRIHSLKRTGEPDCVVKLIEAYFGDVDTIISELSRHADESNVDFSKLTALAHEIEDKSTSIGAEHVRLACADLIQACDKRHKKNFARSLMWVRNEFTHTRNKLESYVQMERRIIRLVNAQAQSSS